MNLILLMPEELGADGLATLRGRRAEHVRAVLRAAPGDRLRVGVVRGAVGEGVVRDVSDDVVTIDVARGEGGAVPVPVPPVIDVVLAVPRPKAVPRVLETLASFGVRRIDLVNAWRVEKSYLGSHRLDEGALTDAVWRGCEQGATTWVPEVAVHPLLVPYLDRTLAPRLSEAADTRRLIAHPTAAVPIEHALPAGDGAPVTLAVGPEGGWIPRELESFGALGFVAVTIGPPVLRTEAAVAALLGQLTLWRRGRFLIS